MFSKERMDEFFDKYDVQKFKLTDWKNERGEKLHPLLKDGPVANIGLILKDTLEPFMPKLNEIIENKDNQYKQTINTQRADKILSISYRLDEIDPLLTKNIEIAIAKKLGGNLFPGNNAEININKAGFDYLGQYGLGTTNWHTDASPSPRSYVQLIIYLVDVNDNDDGPFEAYLEPEKNFYDNETLCYLGVHVGEELKKKELFPKKEQNGNKILGPQYTTVMFVPYFPHRANYPIRKDRIVLALTLLLDNSVDFSNFEKYGLEDPRKK